MTDSTMRRLAVVIATVFIGAILAGSQWISPWLMPWVLGFMLANLGKNFWALKTHRAVQTTPPESL